MHTFIVQRSSKRTPAPSAATAAANDLESDLSSAAQPQRPPPAVAAVEPAQLTAPTAATTAAVTAAAVSTAAVTTAAVTTASAAADAAQKVQRNLSNGAGQPTPPVTSAAATVTGRGNVQYVALLGGNAPPGSSSAEPHRAAASGKAARKASISCSPQRATAGATTAATAFAASTARSVAAYAASTAASSTSALTSALSVAKSESKRGVKSVHVPKPHAVLAKPDGIKRDEAAVSPHAAALSHKVRCATSALHTCTQCLCIACLLQLAQFVIEQQAVHTILHVYRVLLCNCTAHTLLTVHSCICTHILQVANVASITAANVAQPMPAAAAASATIEANTIKSTTVNQAAVVQELEVDLEAGFGGNNTKVLHTLLIIGLLSCLHGTAIDGMIPTCCCTTACLLHIV
jgi:hypothetical protein